MNHLVSAGYLGQGRKVATADEMTALLDELQATGTPVWVQLSIPEVESKPGLFGGAVLDVALGTGFGSLTFYEPGDDGERYDSAGTLGEPQDAEFDNDGTWTPMPTGSAITIEEARAAALEFVTTGRRPECVQWKVFDPPPVELEPMSWDDFEEFDPGKPGIPPASH